MKNFLLQVLEKYARVFSVLHDYGPINSVQNLEKCNLLISLLVQLQIFDTHIAASLGLYGFYVRRSSSELDGL